MQTAFVHRISAWCDIDNPLYLVHRGLERCDIDNPLCLAHRELEKRLQQAESEAAAYADSLSELHAVFKATAEEALESRKKEKALRAQVSSSSSSSSWSSSSSLPSFDI